MVYSNNWRRKSRKIKSIIHVIFLYVYIWIWNNLFYITYKEIIATTKVLEIVTLEISIIDQLIIFIGFLIGFSVKVPIVPIHIWLPHAHVRS